MLSDDHRLTLPYIQRFVTMDAHFFDDDFSERRWSRITRISEQERFCANPCNALHGSWGYISHGQILCYFDGTVSILLLGTFRTYRALSFSLGFFDCVNVNFFLTLNSPSDLKWDFKVEIVVFRIQRVRRSYDRLVIKTGDVIHDTCVN